MKPLVLLALLATGCYQVHTITTIDPTAARAAFTTPHDDAFILEGVRISPDSTLLVHHDKATTRVSAKALRASAAGLTLPSATIPWTAIDRVQVRRLDGATTLLLFVASAGIVAGCAYYDCFSRVPR